MLGSCALTAAAGVAGGGVIIHRSLSSSAKSEIVVDNSPKKMDGEGKEEETQVEDISVPEGLDMVRNLEGFECRVDGSTSMVTQDTACVEELGYDVSQEGYLNPAELDDDEIQIDSPMEQMSN